MADYSERVLAEACGPHGICLKEEFFPSIAKLKKHLDDFSFKQQEDDRKYAKPKYLPPKPFENDTSDCYQGPIEDIKPGDILSHDRIEEYREFMAKKHNMRGDATKLWGAHESWKDNGKRPFQQKPEEPNPFLKDS